MVDMAKAYIKEMRQKWMNTKDEEKQLRIDCETKRHNLKDWAKDLTNASVCCLLWECLNKTMPRFVSSETGPLKMLNFVTRGLPDGS